LNTGTEKIEPAATTLRVLQVEANPLDVELVQSELRRAGFDFTAAVVQTRDDFIREVQTHCPQIVLADYNLPQWRGMEALAILAQENVDVPLILVTGALGEVTAVECLKEGATDYVLKGSLTRLPVAVHRALAEKKLRDQRTEGERVLAHKVEELAHSNQELEQFAYVASHDLQEPLRMVASYTQLLGERYRGKLDENADKYIGYAVDGAQRMQTLIHDLLAFSRAGRKDPNTVDVDCNVVMNDAMLNLAASIQESGAVIVAEDLPVVPADRLQLGQLLQNLIGNAIKFRKENVPAISVKAEAVGDFWQFSVSDNGIGISAEHGEQIFAVFRRLHTRAEYSGNGIGLAICRKIVEHYGGKIWVESTAGEGSIFKFTLPARAGQARGASV
jgi:signal transduction histidine kinase